MLTDSASAKAGDDDSKNTFGFNVKFNKKGTNLQGHINTIIRRTESDGLHIYQIKGTAMTSLAIQPATATSAAKATFNGKANIQDVTNPSSPISVEGNATLQVVMTDKGEPGSGADPDSIAITIWNKDGGLWYSSHFNGTATTEKGLAGGNLQVRGSALEAASTSGASQEAGPLTEDEAASLLQQALALWQEEGAHAEDLAAVQNVTVRVVDLVGSYLGMATPGVVWLDHDAAGLGWSRADAVAVVAHELGHLLGFEHFEHELMHPTLEVGASSQHTVTIGLGPDVFPAPPAGAGPSRPDSPMPAELAASVWSLGPPAPADAPPALLPAGLTTASPFVPPMTATTQAAQKPRPDGAVEVLDYLFGEMADDGPAVLKDEEAAEQE